MDSSPTSPPCWTLTAYAGSGTTWPLTRLCPIPPLVLTSPSTRSRPTGWLTWIPTPASAWVVIEAKLASRK